MGDRIQATTEPPPGSFDPRGEGTKRAVSMTSSQKPLHLCAVLCAGGEENQACPAWEAWGALEQAQQEGPPWRPPEGRG